VQNFTVLSEFITETGRIKHSNLTGLKRKNQRKVAKTIRRAIGLGIIPSVHRHPMILEKKVGIMEI
jgi:small subunit ribosomal protein S18